MVENFKRWLDYMAHAVLILGVLLVAFPVYFVAFIASTARAERLHPRHHPAFAG